MYKKAIAFLIAGIVIGGLGAAALDKLQTNASRTIVVFAGAAAAPVYSEAASMFESKYGVKVELRLGGSGTLLSAMKVAETGDVYIPGSPDYLLQANELGVVNLTVSQGKIMAYLVPAIIVQKGNPKNVTCLEDLAKPGIRVGIGDPASVCVGLYAEELLEVNGLWMAVSPNIVTYAQSCEATAALIPTHAVDAIIGWHVFHYWNHDKADIVWIEPSKIQKISYIAGAVTTFARDRDLAARFLDFLASTDMRETWAKYGYFPTVEEAKAHAPNAAIEMIE